MSNASTFQVGCAARTIAGETVRAAHPTSVAAVARMECNGIRGFCPIPVRSYSRISLRCIRAHGCWKG